MSFKKPEGYNEIVAAALTKEIKKSKGDQDYLAELLVIHARTTARLVTLISLGDKQDAHKLLGVVTSVMPAYVNEACGDAAKLMAKVNAKREVKPDA